MRFLKRFGALLTLSLTFALFCGEVPESLNLSDDASNDFVEPTRGPKLVAAAVTSPEANLQRIAVPIATFPGLPVVSFTTPILLSGPDLLRLLSIQRK
ncbi:MAG: hypothetical protein AUH66_00730 [Acidobacteria bacterium 13_1_40CM_4_57_6]|nr:MAG: hypothetical protein AUH66_00730 [Acidobacteria bacterium 13_1_40CM_4_57_6]